MADDLIVRVANERDAHRSEASKGQKSNVQAEVEFSDGTIQMDTGLLNARCSYTAAAASFAGNMSKEIEVFDFTNIHDDQVKEQIKTYLMTGKTDGVQELDLQKTCDLLLHADYCQALELKSTCLLNLAGSCPDCLLPTQSTPEKPLLLYDSQRIPKDDL